MPFISTPDGDVKKVFITDAWLLDQFVGQTLWNWGNGFNGRLGQNNIVSGRSSPVQTVSGGTNWKQVSFGSAHSAALKTDGSIWLWGWAYWGQLGDNTTTDRSSPVQTVTGGTNWKQVACGYGHTAAIKTDGTLWLWGKNSYGQIGDNTATNRSSPVQTVTGGTSWKQVACGYKHTSAIKTDGTLWCWGANDYGQIGDNTTTDKSSPIQTVTGGTSWLQVACGWNCTAAIKTDGSLWLWGSNLYGNLGDNTIIDRSSPIQAVTGGTNWKQVSLWGGIGNFPTTYAIKSNGSLWCWGYNAYGQIGDNTTTNRSSPVQTVTGATNWKQVACGYYIASAIKSDGSLWTWGRNGAGQLGDNTITHRSSPVQTVAGGTVWKQVACGGEHMGAVKNG